MKAQNNTQIIKQQIVELESKLLDSQKELSDIQKEINNFDASEYVTENQYDDMLDECHDMVTIGHLSYYPSTVLKEVDPIAYRCGYNDYADSVDMDLDSIEDYRDLVQQKETLESEIDDIQNEIDDLNDELSDSEE